MRDGPPSHLSHIGTLEELIRHGLHALRETLQQDKELTVNNTSIGIIGPADVQEKSVPSEGPFRILEGDAIETYLKNMIPKESAEVAAPTATTGEADEAAAPGTSAAAGDEDVQMAE